MNDTQDPLYCTKQGETIKAYIVELRRERDALREAVEMVLDASEDDGTMHDIDWKMLRDAFEIHLLGTQ